MASTKEKWIEETLSIHQSKSAKLQRGYLYWVNFHLEGVLANFSTTLALHDL